MEFWEVRSEEFYDQFDPQFEDFIVDHDDCDPSNDDEDWQQ
jgi:hypothetical protein